MEQEPQSDEPTQESLPERSERRSAILGGCALSVTAIGFAWFFPLIVMLGGYNSSGSSSWLGPTAALLIGVTPFFLLLGSAIVKGVRKKDYTSLIGVLIGIGVCLLIFGLCVAGLSMM